MKQIVIISGKGGTGKTVIAGAFAALARDKVMADCDVDAADLHLILDPEIKELHVFRSGVTAFTHKERCEDCGVCKTVCRFEAVREDFTIDPISCEGCGFCSFACPQKAIEMKANTSGKWFISETRFGPLVHAKLDIAEENSGKLVSLVRQKAKEIAEEKNYRWVIIDGSPGIGCPVIASITGVDCAVIVTEPTLSGLHDAERVIDVTKYFNVPAKVIINKYDLNCDMTEKIEHWFKDKNIQILGKIVFDKAVVESVVEGKTIIEYSDNQVTKTLRNIWELLQEELEKEQINLKE
ncbi:MAG: ATP-binding protein [Actinobacteria bacterium]|nr:ATP-binding protein [Actinomycetota bacterium]